MKRKIAGWLVLCLLLTAGSGLAQEDGLWIRFSEDWVNLLKVQTDVMAAQAEACQAILEFREDTCWENLVDARVKARRAVQTLTACAQWELPQRMTDADYGQIAQMGIDVGDVQAEYSIYNEQTRLGYENVEIPGWTIYYQPILIETVFDADMLNMIAERAAIDLAMLELDLKERYLVNNIILLEIPEEESAKLDAWVKEYVPAITGLYETPFETVNDAINEMVRLMDEGEELVIADSERLTRSEVILENGTEGAAIVLEDQPLTLPYPENWDSEGSEYIYYWKDGDGNIQLDWDVKEHLPDYQIISIPNADAAFFDGYVELLEQCGIAPTDRTDDTCLYEFEDGMQVMIQREGKKMTLYAGPGQLFFAPPWYVFQP